MAGRPQLARKLSYTLAVKTEVQFRFVTDLSFIDFGRFMQYEHQPLGRYRARLIEPFSQRQ